MIALDELVLTGKTKEAANALKTLGIQQRVLIVTADMDAMAVRAIANIPFATVLPAYQINVRDLVNNAKCVMTESAIRKIEEAYKA